ncbi:MAG: hypothetical protein EBT07_02210 [Actinobacteria bacterium]|nr:hypothetical protein [Actinomycetota bacterium]
MSPSVNYKTKERNMKRIDLIAGTTYSVLASWQSHGKSDRDPQKIKRNSGRKAILQSVTKYKYDQVSGYRYGTIDSFVEAEETDRSIGFIVWCEDIQCFWLARAQEIIAPWDELEERWAVQEAEEAQRRAVQDEENAKRREEEVRLQKDRQVKEDAEKAYLDSFSESIKQSILTLLGGRCGLIESELLYYFGEKREPKARVSLNLKDLERLVEKAMEGAYS